MKKKTKQTNKQIHRPSYLKAGKRLKPVFIMLSLSLFKQSKNALLILRIDLLGARKS